MNAYPSRPTTPPATTIVAGKTELRRIALRSYWQLTKPRLSFLTVITAIVGYLCANPERNPLTLIALLIGTSMAAGSAGALNQFLERNLDARMQRTQSRPLPSGQLTPASALLFGLIMGLGGTVLIWEGTNALAALLTVLTLVSYLLVYTPLKVRSTWNTHVGAIPGALPPLIGWAAATGSIDGLGWILFGILFAWQIPHFMAIAWMHRKDYADAGMVMLPCVETSGRSTGVHSLVFAALLLLLSLLPGVFGYTTIAYTCVALLAGSWFLYKAWLFRHPERTPESTARNLFFASVFYLPLVLAAMVIDRWLLI